MESMAEKIKALRARLGIDQKELSAKIGVDQSTVSKYERGVQEPKREPNMKLADLAGVAYGEWVGVEPVEPDDVRARMVTVVGELCAGDWREAIEWDHDDQYKVPALLDPDMPGYPLQGYIVRGTSMNNYYPDGAVVFVAATIANGLRPVHGDHVIVTRRDRQGLVEASLKEYVLGEDGVRWLWPRSSDPQHQAPLQYGGAEEVTITGIVQASFITRPRRAESVTKKGDDRHRDILARFDNGESLSSIAESHGLSRERVRVIAKNAGRKPRREQ
ncbi:MULTISPECIES: helix-turn-helix domain-containing protein [unclassified Mesorhizobium]|uniref:helix-turn-helix domain-containing protein n=1 Tax=unclassified Mesorhizobium TaxID=325217 RepID=UPI0015E2ADBA|nr:MULTISPECIES: helix-turn-helix domain-containing protein [unclassified Mesorhizobium]